MANKHKITVEISNLTAAQKIALEDLFAVWQQLGGWGCSRWTALYADGDGNFRPDIKMDGKQPQRTELGNAEARWHTLQTTDRVGGTICLNDVYLMDIDEISIAQREEQEKK